MLRAHAAPARRAAAGRRRGARTVYAPEAGLFRTGRGIGDRVAAGEAVADLAGAPLRAPSAGVLRGLVRDGAVVEAGTKVVEVDLRNDPALCFGLGERPRRTAQAVSAILLRPMRPG